MRIWLVTVGEPVPLDGTGTPLLRTGLMAVELSRRGHDVVWWTSGFDHVRRQHRRAGKSGSDGPVRIELLRSRGYSRNVSVRRLLDHHDLAADFRRRIVAEVEPDVVYSSMPTIELASEAAQFGRSRAVPVVTDVRDLWPDIFAEAVSRPMRPLARAALMPLRRQVKQALRDSAAITGVSNGYLDWGLRAAGRMRRDGDAVFPIGYARPALSVEQAASADGWLRKHGIDWARPIVWFLGSFGRTYDLRTVVTAARAMREDGVQFLLSGAGDQDRELRVAAIGLDNVHFTGWIDAAQSAAVARAASVGLMAYAAGAPQGLPNKLFEYMAAGLPIISSLRGETEQLLARHQCGTSYLAGDAADLARAIRAMHGDEARRAQMGRNGLNAFEKQYNAARIYSDLADYLERWANGSWT